MLQFFYFIRKIDRMRQIYQVWDYFLSSQSSKWGQNPYIWDPRLKKEAELEAPLGGAVLHFGTIEGDPPLKSPNNALKIY